MQWTRRPESARPGRLEAETSGYLLLILGIDVQDFISSVDDAGHIPKSLEPVLEAALLGNTE